MIGLIKKAQLTARKNKNRPVVDILNVLLGEIDTIKKRGDEISDALIISRCKKLIEANLECLSTTFDDGGYLTAQNEALRELLPSQIPTARLVSEALEGGARNMGEAMRHLKSKYDGLFDGREVSIALKEHFNNKG